MALSRRLFLACLGLSISNEDVQDLKLELQQLREQQQQSQHLELSELKAATAAAEADALCEREHRVSTPMACHPRCASHFNTI